MITYVTGDATHPQGEGLKIIAHCCNDIGVWGAGFVLALSKRWPSNHILSPEAWYRSAFEKRDALYLGQVIWAHPEPGIYVANIIGQHGTGQVGKPIRYDAINTGLGEVAHNAEYTGSSIHMPRMGAGLAGGSWPIIEAIVNETCAGLDVTVYDLPKEEA